MMTPEVEVAESAKPRALELYRAELSRFAAWMALDRNRAEHIVHAAMSSACREFGASEESSAVRIWLFAAAVREHMRVDENRPKPVDYARGSAQWADLQIRTTEDDERIEVLLHAIVTLPDEYRVPLLMQMLGRFSTLEIARELALPIAVVHRRLFEARERLRALSYPRVSNP